MLTSGQREPAVEADRQTSVFLEGAAFAWTGTLFAREHYMTAAMYHKSWPLGSAPLCGMGNIISYRLATTSVSVPLTKEDDRYPLTKISDLSTYIQQSPC